jgi:hypothetical protein
MTIRGSCERRSRRAESERRLLSALAAGGIARSGLAIILAELANRTGLSRFVWHPPLFFTALVVACTVLVGTTLVPSFFG